MQQVVTPGSRLVALDGLRGVAAIAVLLCHARLPGVPFARGYLAVDLFFLLSGLVIARSYEAQLRDGHLSVKTYALIRLERLYPLLFVGSCVGVALWLAGTSNFQIDGAITTTRAIIGQFLLLPFLTVPVFFLFNGAHWSISFELAANVTHALLVRSLSVRVLWWIVALSAVGLFIVAGVFGSLNVGWQEDNVLGGIPRVGFGFFGGVLLWRARGSWVDRIPTVSLGVPATLLVVAANLPPDIVMKWPARILIEPVLVTLVFPVMVMVTSEASGGRLAAMLGTLSFPLYAIHQPIVQARAIMGADGMVRGAVIVLLILGSWAVGRWFDEPLSDWRRGRRRARAASRPAYA